MHHSDCSQIWQQQHSYPVWLCVDHHCLWDVRLSNHCIETGTSIDPFLKMASRSWYQIELSLHTTWCAILDVLGLSVALNCTWFSHLISLGYYLVSCVQYVVVTFSVNVHCPIGNILWCNSYPLMWVVCSLIVN